MKKPMISAIVLLTIVILMATFGFSLDDTAPMVLPESIRGNALFVCPAANSFWDSIAAGFGQFYRYILMGFFFALIVLAFMWGWALYQNLLQDKFKREDFAKPWGFTKLLFWAMVVITLVIYTPNHYRTVRIQGRSGDWVLCEDTSVGHVALNADLVSAK